MAYTKYSLTPANNNAAPPDGAPEGMLPSAVNDTMRDMMAQIRDVGDGIRGGTYTMTAPIITGGTITGVALTGNTFTSPVISGGSINNTPIGATTASTGKFSTLTNAALTSGRVTYAGTSGVLQDDADFTFNGTTVTMANDASISGLTVGKGGGAVSTNTALGVDALKVNEAGGTNNTAIGYQAADSNTTGDNNVAVGSQALQANTTASSNTAVGYQAGYTNTTGATNVYIGYVAGYLSTGEQNCFVGVGAGYSSTGNYNTFIGRGNARAAGTDMTTGSANTIIGGFSGNQGGLDIRTASNYIVLSDGDGNPRAFWNNEGFLTTTSTTNDQAFAAYRQRTTSGGSVVSFYSDYTATKKLITQFTSEGAAYSLSGTWGTISDQALKENIVDATPKLNDINKLKVRNFNFIGAEDKHLGFVAQEIEQVFPTMVATGEDGYKTVKTSILVPMLVKAIQELKAEVDSLKQQLGK
jgi:hypothetical protein